MLSIVVNGASTEVAPGTTLAELLVQIGIGTDRGGIAVAVDGAVVRRALWASTPLDVGARVEVVTAKQGG